MAMRTGEPAQRPAAADQASSGAASPPAPGSGATVSDAGQPPTGPRARLIGAGELTSAVAALILLGLMFGAKWYGVAGVPDPSAARPAISTAIDGWNALAIVRWVMLLTIIVAGGSVLLHLSQRTHGSRTDTGRLVTALGALTSLLLSYRVLIALPSADRVVDQKLGALLGLACALTIALGGWQSMRQPKTPDAAAAPRLRRRTAAAARRDR